MLAKVLRASLVRKSLAKQYYSYDKSKYNNVQEAAFAASFIFLNKAKQGPIFEEDPSGGIIKNV